MAELQMQKTASVVYSNYNFAFLYFNQKYVELCLQISETMSLREVRRKVSGFMSEFSYAIPSKERWARYRVELKAINEQVINDIEFTKLMEKEDLDFKQEVRAYPTYYKHFMNYLDILSRYVGELSATYMPRTKLQQTLLKFKNDSPFYEKMHEYKRVVFDTISDFKINEFRVRTNTFITFLHAYKLFINEKFILVIEETLSAVISLFCSDQVINLLGKYPDYSNTDLRNIYSIETELQDAILYCNSLINLSLSGVGVIPKIQKKEYSDRTGI